MNDLWIQDFMRKVATGGVLHWAHEQSGCMKEIVLKFFSKDKELTEEEIEILKWYIEQFVDAMPHQPPRWRERLAACTTKKALKNFNWMLVRDYGMDPF